MTPPLSSSVFDGECRKRDNLPKIGFKKFRVPRCVDTIKYVFAKNRGCYLPSRLRVIMLGVQDISYHLFWYFFVVGQGGRCANAVLAA